MNSMRRLTSAETILFCALLEANRENSLAAEAWRQLNELDVVSRTETGAGLYIDFKSVDRTSPLAPTDYIATSIENPERTEAADLLLYFENGEMIFFEAASSTAHFSIERVASWIKSR